jgi:hypothetical protein
VFAGQGPSSQRNRPRRPLGSALRHQIVDGLWAPGTRGRSRGQPGGAEAIRTSASAVQAPAREAAPPSGSARRNRKPRPSHRRLLLLTLCSPPVRPSDLPRRPRRGDDGHLLFYIETSVAKPIQRALDKPWLELDLGVRLEAIEFHRHF